MSNAESLRQIPVIVAAGLVLGDVAGGTPASYASNNGGLVGTVAHPSDGVYVLSLRSPVDPSRLNIGLAVLSDGSPPAWRVDTANAGHPTSPSVTVYLSEGSGGEVTAVDNVLIFQPGGVARPGLVTSWSDVEVFANAAVLPWTLYYDSTMGATVVPATSSLDFRGLCTITGRIGNPDPLTVRDGGNIRNMNAGAGANIACEAVTVPGIVYDLNRTVLIQDGAILTNIDSVSAVAAIRVTTFMTIQCDSGGRVLNSQSFPIVVLDLALVGGAFTLNDFSNTTGGLSGYSDDCIASDATSLVTYRHDDTAGLGPQSQILGSLISGSISRSENLAWSNGTTGGRPSNPTTGQMYFDTDLGIPIFRNNLGQWIDATGTVV